MTTLYVYYGNPEEYSADNDYDFVVGYKTGAPEGIIGYFSPRELDPNQIVYLIGKDASHTLENDEKYIMKLPYVKASEFNFSCRKVDIE